MLPVQQHDVEILRVRQLALLVKFLLRILAVVGGHFRHKLISLTRNALQSDAQHLVHLTVRFGCLEEANTTIVGIAHQPREPILSEIALHLAAEAPCAESQPRYFHPRSSQHYEVSCRLALCHQRETSGDRNRSGCKSGSQEFTSGGIGHFDLHEAVMSGMLPELLS